MRSAPRCPECGGLIAWVHEVKGTMFVALFSCAEYACTYRGELKMDLAFDPAGYKIKGKGYDQIIIDDPEVP